MSKFRKSRIYPLVVCRPQLLCARLQIIVATSSTPQQLDRGQTRRNSIFNISAKLLISRGAAPHIKPGRRELLMTAFESSRNRSQKPGASH